jgi:hypothetical protein
MKIKGKTWIGIDKAARLLHLSQWKLADALRKENNPIRFEWTKHWGVRVRYEDIKEQLRLRKEQITSTEESSDA